MNKKAGYAFRIVLGGYLAWIGIRMIIQMMNERPSNMVFMCVMGGIFVLVGAPYAIYSLKKMWTLTWGEKGGSEEAEPEEVEEETVPVREAAAAKNVSLQKLEAADESEQNQNADNRGAEMQPKPEADGDGRAEESDTQKEAEKENSEEIHKENPSSVRPAVIELDESEDDTEAEKSAVEEEIENDYEEK